MFILILISNHTSTHHAHAHAHAPTAKITEENKIERRKNAESENRRVYTLIHANGRQFNQSNVLFSATR